MQIEAELMYLSSLGWGDLNQLAEKLGYKRSPFPKLKSHESYKGSQQLLVSLQLLRELEELKRRPKPKPLEDQIAELRSEIKALKRPASSSTGKGIEQVDSLAQSILEDVHKQHTQQSGNE